jgi:hypothetical protein
METELWAMGPVHLPAQALIPMTSHPRVHRLVRHPDLGGYLGHGITSEHGRPRPITLLDNRQFSSTDLGPPLRVGRNDVQPASTTTLALMTGGFRESWENVDGSGQGLVGLFRVIFDGSRTSCASTGNSPWRSRTSTWRSMPPTPPASHQLATVWRDAVDQGQGQSDVTVVARTFGGSAE